ncbi:carboxymuconolactone decarboxylase family protein [Neptuniibacter sp. QD72_48]|uniref:carboxymuconolactone decarboxylase family protein n=1 Tax=Neptuniibacter sp. QD72_48 TaxID=3398214 RepID=UPI0039F5E9E5
MLHRIDFVKSHTSAFNTMLQMENYLSDISIGYKLKGLIKIRASMLNECAFCIDMHTSQARAKGESEQRIYALSAWRKSKLFNEEERIALALTEEITLTNPQDLSDQTYQQGLEQFGEKGFVEIIMQITAINAWNRIAIATRMEKSADGE